MELAAITMAKAKPRAKAKVQPRAQPAAKAKVPAKPKVTLRTGSFARSTSKPARKRRLIGPSERATRDELAGMPREVAAVAIAGTALALARGIDDEDNSLTSKVAAAKTHLEIMRELGARASEGDSADGIDNLKASIEAKGDSPR